MPKCRFRGFLNISVYFKRLGQFIKEPYDEAFGGSPGGGPPPKKPNASSVASLTDQQIFVNTVPPQQSSTFVQSEFQIVKPKGRITKLPTAKHAKVSEITTLQLSGSSSGNHVPTVEASEESI